VPRKPRIEEPGGYFHLAARSVDGELVFRRVHDRVDFLLRLGRIVDCYRWLCLSYCLMGNHFHLIVRTPEPNLSRGMQHLCGSYAQQFNKRYGRRGHLFGCRFGSRPVETDAHLFRAHRYVALNPVEAGLCERPEDWRWSSFRATIGLEPAPRFLDVTGTLAPFGLRTAAARVAFRDYVGDEPLGDKADWDDPPGTARV